LESGEVTSIVGDQVVVRADSKPPQIGQAVYSEKAKVGIVSDVIGAVDKPFFVVRPSPNAKISVSDRLRTK
jgi:rRNA processing protein Gar1